MASLRKAINLKCRSCIYDPFCGLGTWLDQVEDCCSSTCELHSVRPRKEAKSKIKGAGPTGSPVETSGSDGGLPVAQFAANWPESDGFGSQRLDR